jgi:hypothetical protein
MLVSVLVAVAVVVLAVPALMPPSYRNQLPGAWAEGCLGNPAVISDVFSADSFSRAGISHGGYHDDRWYECRWTWNPEGNGHQSISLEVEVLDGDEFDDYDGLIETIRHSDWERVEAEAIAGFDSGYCSSSVTTQQFVCRAVDSNLKVGIVATGGDEEIGTSGVSVEDYLAEVGAYVQDRLAR